MTTSDARKRPVKIMGAMLDDLRKNDKLCVFCSFVNTITLFTVPLVLPFLIMWATVQ
jgi:hypothetical protein